MVETYLRSYCCLWDDRLRRLRPLCYCVCLVNDNLPMQGCHLLQIKQWLSDRPHSNFPIVQWPIHMAKLSRYGSKPGLEGPCEHADPLSWLSWRCKGQCRALTPAIDQPIDQARHMPEKLFGVAWRFDYFPVRSSLSCWVRQCDSSTSWTWTPMLPILSRVGPSWLTMSAKRFESTPIKEMERLHGHSIDFSQQLVIICRKESFRRNDGFQYLMRINDGFGALTWRTS